MSTPTAIYVYGVVDGAARISRFAGIDGARARVLVHDGIGAVVSDLQDETPKLGREAIMAHARVLENVLATQTVLPMRFGVVMEDEAAVRERLLDLHREQLVAQLERLDGQVELSLRATYQEEPLLREILAEEHRIRELHEALRGSSPAATYFERIRLGELIAAAVEDRRHRDTQAIMSMLAPLADDFRLSEPRHERIALSASFLTARERVAEFDDAVDDVGRRQQNRMLLKYTGPLPPHSFVTLASGG